MRKPSQLATIQFRNLALGLCILTLAVLSLMSFLWHLRGERFHSTNSMEETWPAGPVVWIAFSVMLMSFRGLVSREGDWQAGRSLAVLFLAWVLASALLGWISLYLAGNVTGFPREAHHAILWTTMTMGVAQLGIISVTWEHMKLTALHRFARVTGALWGGIVTGISLAFGVLAAIESFTFGYVT